MIDNLVKKGNNQWTEMHRHNASEAQKRRYKMQSHPFKGSKLPTPGISSYLQYTNTTSISESLSLPVLDVNFMLQSIIVFFFLFLNSS